MIPDNVYSARDLITAIIVISVVTPSGGGNRDGGANRDVTGEPTGT